MTINEISSSQRKTLVKW